LNEADTCRTYVLSKLYSFRAGSRIIDHAGREAGRVG